MNQVVFLGIFDKIANWIMSGITKALTWLFSNVIAPVFSIVWDNFLKYIVDLIREFIAIILYKLYAFLLMILYAIEQMVYSFSGVKSVNIDGETGNILTILMNQPVINKAFWYITALSLTLCFVFTIVAVMRSTFDFSFDSRKSIGRVLSQFFTAAIAFLIMPAFCYGLIELTTICMNAMYTATSSTGLNASLTDSLYMMTVRTAISESNPNAVDMLARKLSESPMFWYSFNNVKEFLATKQVTLNARDVDLFLGYIGCIVLIINLVALAAVFIRRVMELMVLYVVSPFFVAVMPLDDGERFNKWRKTFIGRLCMGAGMIIALNLMMMVLGVVINSDTSASVSFVNIRDPHSDVVGYVSDVAMDSIVKLLFMVGCILSVRSVGNAITAIMDQDAAQAMNEGMSMPKELLNMAKQAYAATQQFAGGMDKLSGKAGKNAVNKQQAQLAKKSNAAGFKGETANKEELAFHSKLKSQNFHNKAKAMKTNRGERRAAYNNALQKGQSALEQFDKLKTHGERQRFMEQFNKNVGMNALKVDPNKFKSGAATNDKEVAGAVNLDRKIAAAKSNRDKFEKGSANWKKYNDQLNKLNDTKNKFDALGSHAERDAFMDINKDAFSQQEAKSKGEEKALRNLSERAAKAKNVRDSLTKGTRAWKEADEKYNAILEKSALLESMGTHDERNKLVAATKESGKDTSGIDNMTRRQREAMDNVNKRIMTAMSLRNSFPKGSKMWHMYNNQVEELNNSKLAFGSASSDEKNKLMSSDNAFKHMSSGNEAERNGVMNINANIKRAMEDRDRHKPDSAGWVSANNRVEDLMALRAEYINTDSHEGRAAVLNKHVDAFTNHQSSQYTELQGKYNAWKMYEANASTPEAREHAHKMAKSYAGFIESYDRAVGDEGRASVLSNATRFETTSPGPSNLAFTAKEVNAFTEISASGNDNYINDYMNARTHSQRAEVLAGYNSYVEAHNGERPPVYNMPTADETRWAGSIRTTAQKLNEAAASESYSAETRGHMRDLASFFEAAAEEYECSSTHAQRSSTADIANSRFSSIPEEIRQAANLSAPSPMSLSEGEQQFASSLSGTQRTEFEALLTRSERCAYRENYYRSSPGFVQLDEGEEAFYNNHFAEGNFDGYRNTENFRADFMGASSHEERARVIQRYADYVSTADNYDMPGNWMGAVASSIESRQNTINGPTANASAGSFASHLDPETRSAFGELKTRREQQDFMSAYYKSSSSYITPDREEERFYSDNFDLPDEELYRNTPVYRTAFLAAQTHEQRQQVMRDYYNYRLYADESHRPGNTDFGDDYDMTYRNAVEIMQDRTDRVSNIIEGFGGRSGSDPSTRQRRPATSKDNYRNRNGS